ncbi:MAG TPA: DUF2071 domain-containing protein [Terracidiphilus sp.]|jgi:hypothetical protein|nr:DUF2071 domain-containing protein [Terracidiphilus sp.]
MMGQSQIFLTAEWLNVLMLNYAVDPALLQSFVPVGTELDAFDGQTCVSLIGFEFNRTRVAGISIPFHRSFEEVNLRFYVKRDNRRGVVFLRELVPRFAVAAVARLFFGENYQSVSMNHRIETSSEDGAIEANYSWDTGPAHCSMRVETEGPAFIPADGSLAQFITEHYWGYAAQRNGGCLEYEVQHPRWLVRNARHAAFSGDATKFYGAEFAKILLRPPDSAFLAEGSPVTVFKGTRISHTMTV